MPSLDTSYKLFNTNPSYQDRWFCSGGKGIIAEVLHFPQFEVLGRKAELLRGPLALLQEFSFALRAKKKKNLEWLDLQPMSLITFAGP